MGQLQDILAPFYVSNTVAAALWGMLCVQLWTYYTSHTKKDYTGLRVLVSGVGILDTAHQIVVSTIVYEITVQHFGDFQHLSTFPYTLFLVLVVLTHTVGLIVHGFYLIRIWRLSKNSWALTLPVVVLMLAELGTVMYDCMALGKIAAGDTDFQYIITPTLVVNAVQFVTDLTISMIVCYLLSRNFTTYRRTQSMIKHIMLFTLATNLLTSSASFGTLVICAADPSSVFYVPFFVVKARFYANSFMAMLNLRPYFAKTPAHTDTSIIELPSRGSDPAPPISKAIRTPSEQEDHKSFPPINVQISRQWESSAWV